MYPIRRRSVTVSIAALAFLASAGTALAAPPPANAVQQLIDADRAFSQAASGKNVVQAIGAFLADDARAPKPDGTFARSKQEIIDLLSTNPLNLTATADWAPVRGGISADATQGFGTHRPNPLEIVDGGIESRRAASGDQSSSSRAKASARAEQARLAKDCRRPARWSKSAPVWRYFAAVAEQMRRSPAPP